jgi:catechol 2,3-dioxygenase
MHANPWPLREVTLKVLDLQRQVEFYAEFGFRVLSETAAEAKLAAGNGFLLRLQTRANLKPRQPLSAGLFHFAILVNDRETLGSFVRHAAKHRWNLVGAADHLVSEALYFQDPEDNGIEVYADRPRGEWEWHGSRVQMATLPLDLEALAQGGGEAWAGFPDATRLGHIHLTVTNLDVSQNFYESLGFTLTANWGPFRFFSFDGYHHHLAINLAAGHNAAPVPADATGILGYSLLRDTVTREVSDPARIHVFTPQAAQ